MNAQVTQKKLYYDGSIGIDKSVMEAANIFPGEQVQVLNVNNGERFVTYVIEEEAGSHRFVLYGPAARLGEENDTLVILSYCMLETKEAHNFEKCVVKLGKSNKLEQ